MDDSYRFYPKKWMIHTDSIKKKDDSYRFYPKNWMIQTLSKKKMIHTDPIQKNG